MARGYVDASHGQMHYHCNARREGTPLLLLHQSPSDSRMYDALMAELDADLWMVAPDSPGFGNSDPLPTGFSMEGCARALLEVLDALDIDRCFLFGHHTGAAAAVQLAVMNPELVERIVLSGPTLLSDELKATLPGRAAPFPVSSEGGHLLSMWQRMSAKEADADPGLLLREVISAFEAGDSYAEAYAAVAAQDFETQLRSIESPVLVCAGTDDVLYPQLDAAFQCLRQGHKRVIEGAGSYVCDRRPGELAQIVREFLAPRAE